MSNKLSTLMLTTLCGVMFTSMAMAEVENKSGNVPVGERAESYEELQLQAQLKEESAEAMKAADQAEKMKLLIAKAVNYTTHPGAYHNMMAVSIYGDIELEDGSFWLVSPGDASKSLSWYGSDLLVITVNQSWFSSYKYKITNQSTGQSVSANLNLGPKYNGIYTRWISAIDYYYSVVYLNDGSVWDMSAFDSGIVNKWMPNDTVIIGVNDSFFSSSNPNILINVNMSNYAAGRASY